MKGSGSKVSPITFSDDEGDSGTGLSPAGEPNTQPLIRSDTHRVSQNGAPFPIQRAKIYSDMGTEAMTPLVEQGRHLSSM